MLNFCPSKFRPKKYVWTTWIFLPVEILSKKVCGKNVDVSTSEITSRKVRGNNLYFSTSEVTPKKVSGNNLLFYHQNYVKKVCGNVVNFSTINVTSEKVCGNDLDILISEITLKKYVEMMWKIAEVWLLTYQSNIDVKSTCIWHFVSFVYAFTYQDEDFRLNSHGNAAACQMMSYSHLEKDLSKNEHLILNKTPY